MTVLSKSWEAVVLQIATSYSQEGSGFYLPNHHLIVTNEHIVSDHKTVIIGRSDGSQFLAEVLFADALHDLAFLSIPDDFVISPIQLPIADQYSTGEKITIIGQSEGQQFQEAVGELLAIEEGSYLRHNTDIALSNGSLLLNAKGKILGMSSFVQEDSQLIGVALPIHRILEIAEAYQKGNGSKAVRCLQCEQITFEPGKKLRFCSHCGAKVTYLSTIKEYEPTGVAKTIEEIITRIGHEVKLARRAPNNWEIYEGSAKVIIAYHEDSGLITGDAYLCLLPKDNLKAIYQFLLEQNKVTDRLTFSLHPSGQEIILSLLIFDRYLDVNIGMQLFQHLLERADYYDNVLVEEYGASWASASGFLRARGE